MCVRILTITLSYSTLINITSFYYIYYNICHCITLSTISSYKPSVLLLLLLLWNCCTILYLCLKSEIMDGFFSSRCLNDRIDLPDKIGSFLSGATTPMVVKNGTKKIIPLPMIKLSISQPFEELQG